MSILIEKQAYKALKKSVFWRPATGLHSSMDGMYYALFSIVSPLVVLKILNKRMSRKYLSIAKTVLGFHFIRIKQIGTMTLFTS